MFNFKCAYVVIFYLTDRKTGHILICSLCDLQHYFDPLVVVRAELYEKTILKVEKQRTHTHFSGVVHLLS